MDEIKAQELVDSIEGVFKLYDNVVHELTKNVLALQSRIQVLEQMVVPMFRERHKLFEG